MDRDKRLWVRMGSGAPSKNCHFYVWWKGGDFPEDRLSWSFLLLRTHVDAEWFHFLVLLLLLAEASGATTLSSSQKSRMHCSTMTHTHTFGWLKWQCICCVILCKKLALSVPHLKMGLLTTYLLGLLWISDKMIDQEGGNGYVPSREYTKNSVCFLQSAKKIVKKCITHMLFSGTKN